MGVLLSGRREGARVRGRSEALHVHLCDHGLSTRYRHSSGGGGGKTFYSGEEGKKTLHSLTIACLNGI